MSYVADEILMAYADGELTPEECQALERLLRQDAALRVRLAPFVETRAQLATAFEPTLREPVPDRLIKAIERARPQARASMTSVPLGGRLRLLVDAAAARIAPGGFTPALAASMATLVVAGAAVGWLAGRANTPAEAPPSLIATSGPDLVASGALAYALDANPSRTVLTTDNGRTSIEPIVSFRTTTDSVCREYRVTVSGAKQDAAGLACRTPSGTWRIAQHVETPKQPARTPATDGTYQTATGINNPAIDAMVETMISGEAFGADDEALFLKNAWQSPQ
ncbi:MAG: hypothetical protein J0H65_11090 [Rhizobiales bacterium]|nr:hypothetical protein [Hyphomicrobiales bacterium]